MTEGSTRASRPFGYIRKVYVVAAMIRSTCPDECIVSIDKCEVPELEATYETYKQGLSSVKEATVFHGTSEEAIWPILRQGFDVKKQTRNVYGIGTYFGATAQASRTYAKANQQEDNVLLVCKLALGPTHVHGMRQNQPLPPEADYGTDTLVSPTMYVMPRNEGAIPLYVVRFYAPAADKERRYGRRA